jgi:hypothetical protein
MCFSASASFAAGGFLSVTGAAALRESRKSPRVLLAAIPLLFALHQASEGVLWLSFSSGERAAWRQAAILIYLVIAKAVWQLWIPLAVLAPERNPERRKILLILLALGSISSLSQAYGLWAYPVSVRVLRGHLQYELDYPWGATLVSGALYVLPTVLPPFFSSLKRLRWLGLVNLGSFILSAIYFRETLGSVWCFFAGIISAMLFLIVRTRDADLERHRVLLDVRLTGDPDRAAGHQ